MTVKGICYLGFVHLCQFGVGKLLQTNFIDDFDIIIIISTSIIVSSTLLKCSLMGFEV
jgi:hypothetical protein